MDGDRIRWMHLKWIRLGTGAGHRVRVFTIIVGFLIFLYIHFWHFWCNMIVELYSQTITPHKLIYEPIPPYFLFDTKLIECMRMKYSWWNGGDPVAIMQYKLPSNVDARGRHSLGPLQLRFSHQHLVLPNLSTRSAKKSQYFTIHRLYHNKPYIQLSAARIYTIVIAIQLDSNILKILQMKCIHNAIQSSFNRYWVWLLINIIKIISHLFH